MGSVRVNGVLGGALDPLDRGLAYGDGLFETIAARSGEARFLAEHLERLAAGCTQLGLPPPDAGLLSKELRAEAAAIGQAPMCTANRLSALTRRPDNASGTSRSCITGCGTTTRRQRQH